MRGTFELLKCQGGPMILPSVRALLIWLGERLRYGTLGLVGACPSDGYGLLDGAIVLAAHNGRGRMGSIRRLLALGANPSSFGWFALMSAASWGDAELVRQIVAIGKPPDEAFEHARAYAKRGGHPNVLYELAAARSRMEREQLSTFADQAARPSLMSEARPQCQRAMRL